MHDFYSEYTETIFETSNSLLCNARGFLIREDPKRRMTHFRFHVVPDKFGAEEI